MQPEFRRAMWAYVYPDNNALADLVQQAKGLHCDCIIAKCGNGATYFDYANRTHVEWRRVVYAVKANGLKLGAEAYQYGYRPEAEGGVLARACADGADFAVCNAEKEFEQQDASVAVRLVEAYRAYCGKPFHLCVDTRKGRCDLPYQRGFRVAGIDGHMPMVYPDAFYPNRQHGWIQNAFDNAMYPASYYDLPTYPVIQAYGHMDYQDTMAQLVLAQRWKATGVGIYAAHDINVRAWWGIKDAPVFREVPTPNTYTRDEILEKIAEVF